MYSQQFEQLEKIKRRKEVKEDYLLTLALWCTTMALQKSWFLCANNLTARGAEGFLFFSLIQQTHSMSPKVNDNTEPF